MWNYIDFAERFTHMSRRESNIFKGRKEVEKNTKENQKKKNKKNRKSPRKTEKQMKVIKKRSSVLFAEDDSKK